MKRLGLANIAIFLFIINSLLLAGAVALTAVNYQAVASLYSEADDDGLIALFNKIMLGLLIYFAILLGLQIFINLPGSIKTRKLLKSRRAYEIACL